MPKAGESGKNKLLILPLDKPSIEQVSFSTSFIFEKVFKTIPDGGIRAVQTGQLAATFTFIYPTCAKEAADYAEKIVHHQQVEHKLVLGTVAVTPDNAADLYKQYNLGS